MTEHTYKTLKQMLSQLEDNFTNILVKNPSVSKASIGWQIDHTLKVFNAVCHFTANSNPEQYIKKFNAWRTILFPLCYLPRGKAKAPKQVLPPEHISPDDLKTQLKTARAHIITLKTLPKNAYFNHFVFGHLNKAQTLRFLEMHSKHHLKIINDILDKA